MRVLAGGVRDGRPAAHQRGVMTAAAGAEGTFLLTLDNQTDGSLDGRSGKLQVAIRYKKNVVTLLPAAVKG